MRANLEKTITVLALTALFYFLTYFAVVRRGVTFEAAGCWSALPDYRGLPALTEVCFRPLHNWDRTSLRPRIWEGRMTEAERAAQARALTGIPDAAWKKP